MEIDLIVTRLNFCDLILLNKYLIDRYLQNLRVINRGIFLTALAPCITPTASLPVQTTLS